MGSCKLNMAIQRVLEGTASKVDKEIHDKAVARYKITGNSPYGKLFDKLLNKLPTKGAF